MRDGLLMVVVVAMVVTAMVSPRYGLFSYLWFSLFRPDILAFSEGRPYSLVLAAVTFLSSVRFVPQLFELVRNPWVLVFIGYQLATASSVLMAISTDMCFPDYRYFLTTSGMALLIPLLVRERQHLHWLLVILGGSVGLLGTKLGLYGLLAGGAQFSQGYGGMLTDNNLLALAFVTSVPLLWYSIGLVRYFWLKMLFGFMLLASLAAIAMCHSRGGILALAVVMVLMAWKSKRRMAAFVMLGVLALPGVWLVRDTLLDRMSTLSNIEEDESAVGRITFWKAAIRVGLDYPLFGVGFGGENYRMISGSYIQRDFTARNLVVHNTYLQVLADSGFPALFFYCVMLFGGIYWLRKTSKALKIRDPEMSRWAEGLMIALCGYAVGSTFLSRVGYDFPYMLLLSVAAMYQLKLVETAGAGATERADTQPMAPELISPPLPGSGFEPSAPLGEPEWRRPGAGRRLRESRSG